jgi:hypothetical protein
MFDPAAGSANIRLSRHWVAHCGRQSQPCGLWAAASAGLGVTLRTEMGLPQNLIGSKAPFDLPKVGAFLVTLHRKSDRNPAAVERLDEIVREVVMGILPRNPPRP